MNNGKRDVQVLVAVISCSVLFWLGLAHAALPVAVDGVPMPSLAPMLERVTPAVVNIAAKSLVAVHQSPLLRDPFFRRFFNLPGTPRTRETQSLGSGVIVDAEAGLILTNLHVIDKANEITVTLHDGQQLKAELIGGDPDTDIAVIRVSGTGLSSVPMANSDELRVGDFVVAIGNPFGLGQTVTSGIVSALGRRGLGIEGYEDFIQTDASINVGNSGGALVNLRGELVGINTAIFAPNGGSVGIGFAIPTNLARNVMTQLFGRGKVERGLFGVATQKLTQELAEAFGLLRSGGGAVVVEVHDGTPAARSGIQAGDIITAINGKATRNPNDLHNEIGLRSPGEEIRVTLIRNGVTEFVTATLIARDSLVIEARSLHRRLDGAQLSDIRSEHELLSNLVFRG